MKKKEDDGIWISAGCFGLIFFLALVLIPPMLNEDTNSDQKAAQTQETIENNKEEIKKIEGYIREFQKAGIFVKVINRGVQDGYKLLEIQVDEYAWNNLDYDTKVATENMLLRYWEIGNVTTLFKGYRTGQTLYRKSKNFKI